MRKNIFSKFIKGNTGVFIDYANVKSWVKHLSLYIDLKVLFQNLKLDRRIDRIYFYYGTDVRNPKISSFFQRMRQIGYEVVTKPVKYLEVDLVDLLNKPVNKQLLNKLDGRIRVGFLKDIERIRKKRIKILAPKCNFDTEITLDMVLFQEKFDTFVLFSGDGDFEAVLKYLRGKGKRVIVVSLRKFLSGELFKNSDYFVNFKRLIKVKNLVYKNKNP